MKRASGRDGTPLWEDSFVPSRPRDFAATARVTVAWKAYAEVYSRRYSYDNWSVALIFGGPVDVNQTLSEQR